jgi:hypothetical protein
MADAPPVYEIKPAVSDPRASSEKSEAKVSSTYIRPQFRKLHDPDVTFEEYHYHALRSRAEEDELSRQEQADPAQKTTFLSLLLPSKNAKGDVVHSTPPPAGDVKLPLDSAHSQSMESGARGGVTDDEWKNASRALRTATWSAVFYLITTDILGPFNVP